jgi:transcriptional regulator with XRE-family HTH domain
MQKQANVEYATRLGRRLRVARRKARLSARMLGDAIGVHRNTVWRWEAGIAEPRVSELHELQRVLMEKGCRL